MSYHFALPVPVSRSAVENQIEALIAVLDALDGDADDTDCSDAEDDFADWSWMPGVGCPVADPGGGNVEDERQAGEGQDFYSLLPEYRIDQSLGPINEHAAFRAHQREI
ncbi:hypothetical protein [Sphingobium sp.]|uniref:hypothetical protein n=1 Tax=Sphingobium sp. TaxID=1912891 RepID=UPI003BB810AB